MVSLYAPSYLFWLILCPRLFIVDGIISLPIALAGFLFIPDVPETTRAFYLTQDVSGISHLVKQL